MSAKLPLRLLLPSGRALRVAARTGAHAVEPAEPPASPFEAARALLEGPVALSDDAGERVDAGSLDVRDFHVLRVVLAQAGLLGEPEVRFRCANCDTEVVTRPALEVELAPFVDGELDDPQLDAPFDFEAQHPTPPLRVGRAEAASVTLAPVSLDASMPLFRALARPSLRIDARTAQALGVVAVGDERRAAVIARALARADDDAFDAIVDLVDEARYARRLVARVRCDACGAVELVDAPAARECPRDFERADEAPAPDGFPDADGFERLVRAAADATYRSAGVAPGAVDLVVDDDVPDVDDGGVALLGSYVPACVDPDTGAALPAEVRLYFRTFRAMWGDEPFDLDAEVRETLAHELAHHLAALAGDDPTDEAERAEIAEDAARHVGRSETIRRARSAVVADLAGFVRTTWPVWLIVGAATLLSIWLDP